MPETRGTDQKLWNNSDLRAYKFAEVNSQFLEDYFKSKRKKYRNVVVVKSKGTKTTITEHLTQLSAPFRDSLSQVSLYDAISDSLMLARGVLSISVFEGGYFSFLYFQKKGLVDDPCDLTSAMVVATRNQIERYIEHLKTKCDIEQEDNLIELHKIFGFMDLYLPHEDWLGSLLRDEGWSRIDYLIDSKLLQTFSNEFRDI